MNAIGRPTKYRKKYCEQVIELAKQGRTIEETCANFDISIDTYYKWIKRHAEFAEANQIALNHRITFWVKLGRNGMTGKQQVKENTWRFFMMNIAKWGHRNIDEAEVGIEDKNRDELENELMELADRVKAKRSK